MTIIDLMLYIGIVAAALTLFTGLVLKCQKSWLMSYAQHFSGSLFIFSGFVKAVDPLGTAFKMEQYFAEFFYTFKDTAVSFIAPLFPALSESALTFSVVMIVFEIVLGVMLILGSYPKLTAWLFFLLVAFFTVLTGFTFLTGYVPSGVNFFQFSQWGEYVETNMRVTDCGCFGDFLKLKPEVSFYKDLFLLIPSIYFVLRFRDMHELFNQRARTVSIAASGLLFLVFCIRNVSWDEPVFDFRPFKAGTDVRTRKQEEEQALAEVKITDYKMTNKASGEVVVIPLEQYMKEFKNYPKEEWSLEQIKTKPAIEPTKISDFDISDLESNNVTEDILNHEGYSFMIVAYKMKSDDEDYSAVFKDKIGPLTSAARKAGHQVYAVTKPEDPAVVEAFRQSIQSDYPFYVADDLLLKTIQRSNPGLVLWKNGAIVAKWHYKKLPAFESIQAEYLSQ
jgi:uncharacterized membrane protein YphA (DoxX/SURF4 family)